MVCRSVSRPASGRFALNQWTQLTLTRREAAREESVANLIAALSSMMTGNVVHFLGIDKAREEFDTVILRARSIDETQGDPE
jgi:hypothetical protein